MAREFNPEKMQQAFEQIGEELRARNTPEFLAQRNAREQFWKQRRKAFYAADCAQADGALLLSKAR